MAGHRLIDDYLDRLARDLPAGAVDELADGLTETWQRHLAAGLPPGPAARAAITEFGAIKQVTGAFVARSPARRAARWLLATGPLVGVCWGAAIAGQAWTWRVPAAAAVPVAATLLAVVVLLLAAATARHSCRRARLGAYGCLGLIGLDLTMLAIASAAAPAGSALTAFAAAASLVRIGVTARFLPRVLVRG